MTTRHRVGRLSGVFLSMALIAGACGSDEATETAASTTAAPTTTEATTTTVAAPPKTLPPVTAPEPIPPAPPEGMELVWSDEFDGDAINLENWTYDIGGWGWGNGEAQYYTDRPDNARIEDGLLIIEARQERFDDSYYTSARLKTQDRQQFRYGRIEARMKVPEGAGLWPAFWMLGSGFEEGSEDPARNWPNVGEIDVMEYIGREPDLVMGTIHGPGYSGALGLTTWHRPGADIADDFHTFAVDWDEEGIRWYFDGEQYAEKTPASLSGREWVFDQPFFIILNVALGGTLGGFISPELEFPVYMYVDHVRVYQRIDADQ